MPSTVQRSALAVGSRRRAMQAPRRPAVATTAARPRSSGRHDLAQRSPACGDGSRAKVTSAGALAPLAGHQQDAQDRQQEPCGVAAIPMKLPNVRSGRRARRRRTITMIGGGDPDDRGRAASRPARVSNILRSSTPTRRENGTRGRRPRCRGSGGGRAVALMPVAPCGEVVALGVGGELEEEVLEAAVAARRSVRTTLASAATWPTSTGVAARPAARRPPAATARPAAVRAAASAALSSGRDRACVAVALGEQRLLVALGDDPAAADEDHLVGDQLDLVEQVAGEQHGAAAVGVPLEQAAHPPDAGRVEAVGGLVEDQHRRVAEQGVGDAEPLPHAERVVAHPALGLGRRQRDQREHLVDPATSGSPMVRAPMVSTSRPVRPACWAEASRRTPTWRPGLGMSR